MLVKQFASLGKASAAADIDSAADQMHLSEEDNIFAKVLAAEHGSIAARRRLKGRPELVGEVGGDKETEGHRPVYNTTGVALSGGGIRSAAFCLGTLQSLEAKKLIGGLDYLSTVSGGGYIGASMSGCMAEPTGAVQEFPFGAPNEFEDREAVGHLRDYSNYILPRGGNSFIDALAVLLRGWAANIVFILSVLFPAAWLVIVAFPKSDDLGETSLPLALLDKAANWLGYSLESALTWVEGTFSKPFTISVALLVLLAFVLVFWGFFRSLATVPESDVSGRPIRFVHGVLATLIAIFLIELQPLAVKGFFQTHDWLAQRSLLDAFKGASIVLAPFSGAIVFFRDKLSSFLKTSEKRSGTAVFVQRLAVQAAIWIAALVLPLLVYIFFLWLCAAGIVNGGPHPLVPPWPVINGRIAGWYTVAWTYFAVSVSLYFLFGFFKPNANSLHRLYRDKLSKAFLFDPVRGAAANPRDDLPQRDALKLSDISPATGGPYHLVNAAINLQNSKYANRRGRNATFFLFSSKYIGSDVTGYVATRAMEKDDRRMDLGTAMAISGAAVSANMGTYTIAALAPTLALLNVRLGYWLINPRAVKAHPGELLIPDGTGQDHKIGHLRRLISFFFKGYLWAEILGLLDETSPHIYVTDGGHIENLGLYQLLKRGCRAVIVVDGEADPDLAFRSLATVERYARIDLGIRIDLPWEQIAHGEVEWSPPPDDKRPASDKRAIGWPVGAPHCALGIIHYPNGQNGMLLYVKASTSGDEPDYILDYQKRNPSFPHESTGDQFFSEEQFEAYRALGFHAVQTFFDDRVGFVWRPGNQWNEFRKASSYTGQISPDPITATELRECFLELLK